MAQADNNFRPALYYPYVHIRDERWLKATLLCVPVVKRMVPDTYTPEDERKIVPYTGLEGPYGPLLQNVPAYTPTADRAQQELLRNIKENAPLIKRRYSRLQAQDADRYWIHDAKFAGSLLRYLEENHLAWRSSHPNEYGHRNWYALHPALGKAIMTTIGLSIAREQNFDIVTADGKYHEALLATDDDAIFNRLLRPLAKNEEISAPQTRRDLGELVIAFAGVNLKALLPEHIPELQTSKHFKAFQRTLRVSASSIDRDTDSEEYERQLQEEPEKIVTAWQDVNNDVSKELREVLFDGIALAETVRAAAAKPGLSELVIAGGIGLWRLATKVGQYAKHRRSSHHFLTQIHKAQTDVLQIQYPLGI
jgi:hypothetical protein